MLKLASMVTPGVSRGFRSMVLFRGGVVAAGVVAGVVGVVFDWGVVVAGCCSGAVVPCCWDHSS